MLALFYVLVRCFFCLFCFVFFLFFFFFCFLLQPTFRNNVSPSANPLFCELRATTYLSFTYMQWHTADSVKQQGVVCLLLKVEIMWTKCAARVDIVWLVFAGKCWDRKYLHRPQGWHLSHETPGAAFWRNFAQTKPGKDESAFSREQQQSHYVS